MSSLAARCRAVFAPTATVAACLLLAGTATAAAAPATDGPGCPVLPTVQPFAAWQDFAEYLIAPDGGLEAGGAGWDLEGGASVVAGNESFNVGGAGDRHSLNLPAGSTATTAQMCIGEEHKTMRFFAMGMGTVKVEVLYAGRKGKEKSVTIGKTERSTGWAPTDILPLQVNDLASAHGNAMMVALRFTTRGHGAAIDDVYVDPWRIR